MQYVSLALNILFAVFLVFGFLWGLKRGLKRTLTRSVWIILVVVLLILLSANITSFLLNLNVGLSYAGEKCGSFKNYLMTMLTHEFPVEGGDYAGLVEVLFAGVSILLNSFVFLILYWILKLVSLPLYWIANIFIFSRERRLKKKAKKEKNKKFKIKKYRLFGGLVGIVLGLISFCMTMTPIVGYVSLVDNFNKSTIKDDKGAVSSLVGEPYDEFINAYNSAIPTKVLGTVGINSVVNGIFKGLSSSRINGEKVSLNGEAETFAKLYNAVDGMEEIDINTATQEEFNNALESINGVVDIVFESKLISSTSDIVVPFAVKYARTKIDTSTYKPYVLNLYNALFDELEGLNSKTAHQEIRNVISFVQTLNKHNLFLPIVQNPDNLGIEFLKDNLTEAASDEIVNSLFAISSVNNIAPAFVNFVLGFGAEKLDYEYVGESNVTSNVLKDSSSTILKSMVKVVATYDESRTTKVELNEDTIGAIGGIFDEIKKVLSDENFKSIVNAIEPKVQEVVDESLENQPEFFQKSVKEAVGNISEISNYKTDFVNVYKSVDSILTQFDDAYENDKYNVQYIDFTKLGENLDKIQSCGLFKNSLVLRTMKDAVNHYSDKFEKDISTTEKPFAFTFDAVLISNLDELISTGVEWKLELPKYKDTVGILSNLFQGEGAVIDKIKSENDHSLEDLGRELDTDLKDSKLFKNADRKLVADILDIADIEFNTDNDEDLTTLLSDAKANVLDERVEVVWENEFYHIKTLAKQKFEDSSDANLLSIASAIDTVVFGTTSADREIPKSNLFTQDMINVYISNYMDKVFTNITEEDDFYDTINTIKNSFNTRDIVSYFAEIDSLLKLKSVKDVANSDTFDFKTDGALLGQKIDESLAVENKVVVDKALVNGFIIKKIDTYFTDYSSDLEEEIVSIKTGFNDEIEKYEVEFVSLGNLMRVSDKTSADGFSFKNKANAESLGESIDVALKQVRVNEVDYTSKIVTPDLINGYIKKYVDKNVTLSNAQFGDVLTNIIGEKKVVGGVTTFEDGRIDFVYNLYVSSGYKTEFGYLSQLLIVSDAFSNITINNINAEVKLDAGDVTKTTLADQFDGNYAENGRTKVLNPLKNSFLVGDSLLTAISSAFETYKNDSANQRYLDILTEVNSNYNGIKSDINWLVNGSGTTTYTDLINAFDEVNLILNGDLTADIDDITTLGKVKTGGTKTYAQIYDETLQSLQGTNSSNGNILFKTNGTNALAKFVFNKVRALISGAPTTFANQIAYIDNYVSYLDSVRTANTYVPYGSSTETTVEVNETTIQLNSPFQHIVNMFD